MSHTPSHDQVQKTRIIFLLQGEAAACAYMRESGFSNVVARAIIAGGNLQARQVEPERFTFMK